MMDYSLFRYRDRFQKFWHRCLVVLIGWSYFTQCAALTFPLPTADEDLIGHVNIVQSQAGDTLYKVSRRFEMGYYEMIKANPKLPAHGRIPDQTGVVIPSFFVLPDVPRSSIVINLPEMRLYYYSDDDSIITEPISIGRMGWETPEISTYVLEKIKDPIWVVPESIQEYSYEKGILLPNIMAPGPENPLGQYALRLAVWSILIHGTNNSESIGQRISSGCIRLYPEDIEYFYKIIEKGTPVRIINQSYKAGWYQGHLYLEVHKPLEETFVSIEEEESKIYQVIKKANMDYFVQIDWPLVARLMKNHDGIPHRISFT